jgi:predicted metal-dependent TIM-barrel fold hydrolase
MNYYARLVEEKKNYNREKAAYRVALSLWKKKPSKEIEKEMMEVHHFSKNEALRALDQVGHDELHKERAKILKKAGFPIDKPV